MDEHPPPMHPPPIARHEAQDRIGRLTLGTVHDLGLALAESGSTEGEPVVVRTGGPHRTLDGLVALIDEALADDAASADRDRGGAADGGPRPPSPDVDPREPPPSS
jgi:hypothetical protein